MKTLIISLTPIVRLSAIVVMSCLLWASQATAQPFPSLFGKGEGREKTEEVTLPASDAEMEKARKALAARRTQVGRAVGEPGITEERRALLIELRRLLDQQDSLLKDLANLRLVATGRDKEMREWKGFQERPLHTLEFIEGLREAYFDELLERRIAEFRLAFARRLVDDYAARLSSHRSEMRNADEALRSGRGGPDERALTERLETAKLRVETSEAGVTTFALQRLMLEEALASQRRHLSFVEGKIRIARDAFPLSQADLEKKMEVLSAKSREIERQIDGTLAGDERLREELRRADDELVRARDSASGTLSAEDRRQRLASLQARHDVLSARVESLRIRTESLRGIRSMIDYEKRLWRQWFALGQKEGVGDVRKSLREAEQNRSLIEGWRHYVDTGVENVYSLISTQQQRRQAQDVPPAGRNAAAQLIEIYQQRVTDLYETARHLLYVLHLTESLGEDLKRHQAGTSPTAKIRSNLEALRALGTSIWEAELYVVEDSVIVDGRKISTPRSVTLGKVMQALALLIAGLWMARRMVVPLKGKVARRLNLDDNQKDQFGKMLYMILFMVVLIFSFMFARIPLAVFAFLGGALAIGVGFGAQNIINNFISGIILMFDKSIRVGDIVEVDGQGGKVTSIGMRSSHIVRFDGIEMLVPNSQFLQQKVTNWTLTKNQIRFQITVGAAYGSKTDEVVRLLKQAADEHSLVLKSPQPSVIFSDFGDNALVFNLFFWIELGPGVNGLVVSSDLRHRIYRLFDESGIVISFPQRDVHLDTPSPLEVKVVSRGAPVPPRGQA